MQRKFYIILISQFLSALADNALLFAAIALLSSVNAPEWHTPLLKELFVISYIVFAPFVGPFADAIPKGKVMFISNGIKLFGCFLAFIGFPPLYAYAVVGIGSAFYSPAKYGILTELLPSNLLIKANAWVEGTTVLAIILGPVIGSTLARDNPYYGIGIITGVYLLASIFAYFIPKLPIDHKLPSKAINFLLKDFWHAFTTLWRDPQGQVSLAVTTLFWAAGATLQFVILRWASITLGFTEQKAAILIAILAVGVAAGSVLASFWVKLEESVKVLPAGIYMGFLVMGMTLVSTPEVAAGMLFIIGVLAGYFLVPLNSLLQHRGQQLLGAGHSIAVQNFNENLGILLMLGIYTLMVGYEVPINLIIIIFGIFISSSMALIIKLYWHSQKQA